jgi:uncharacterized protein YjbI with pentapeptide repeats
LQEARLDQAALAGADLTYANLEDAEGVTGEHLKQQAKTLEGATIPNGQKYEDWLESKSSEEDG